MNKSYKIFKQNAIDLSNLICNDDLLNSLNLSEKSKLILKMRWRENKAFCEIASVYNVSNQRVIAIYSKTIKELSSNINIITKNILTQKEEIHQLKVSENTLLIETFPISTKKLKLFHVKNIFTINDVLQFSKKDLLKMSGIGVKTVWDLENSLEKIGYFLRK